MNGTSQTERPSDPWLDHFRDVLRPGMLALDLGCGTGEDTAELVEMGLRVVSVDRDAKRLSSAREQEPEAFYLVLDMTRGLPFLDETFDVVIASLSIHYFDHATTLNIIREVARVLRAGATFICRVNRVGDVNFEYGKGTEWEPDFFEVRPGKFKRFFSEELLRTMLETALVDITIRPDTTTRWKEIKQTLVTTARRG